METLTTDIPRADGLSRDRLASVAMLLAVMTIWALQHPYMGLWHDTRLYLLQALVHLKPALLGNDIFVRFGSQDRFTIFSPLYAKAIELLGLEPATACLTLLCHVAFITSAWFLARSLLPHRMTWLAIGLLVALPADYGAYRTFSYLEDFLTPRLPAEALVLAGLTAMVARRPVWMWTFMVAAALLHPLMAAGGIVVVSCAQFAFARPKVAGLLCAISAAGALVVICLTPLGAALRFDDYWLTLTQRNLYLWPSLWQLEDWTRIAVPMTTLAIGTLTLEPSPARSLCGASLLAAVAGFALTWVGEDLLHVILIAQVQPWRWSWIAGVMAVTLLPLIVARSWQTSAFGRAAALLMLPIWLLRGETWVFAVIPLALGTAILTPRSPRLLPRQERILVGTAGLIALLTTVWTVANICLYAPAIPDESHAGALVRQARAWTRDGTLPAFAMIGLSWLTGRALSPGAVRLGVGALMTTVLAMAPSAITEWTWLEFPPETYRAFASWRQLIPPGEEVFWVDGPLASWVLLERPSYLSILQAAGTVFSRSTGALIDRRARALERFAVNDPGAQWILFETKVPQTTPTLASVCAASDVKFIATRLDLKAPPLAAVPPGLPARYRMLRLYSCDHLR